MKNIIFILGIFMSLHAFAQGGKVGGGGSITESQLQTFLNRLDDYLYSEDGKKEMGRWLNVVSYDQDHPKHTLKSIIETTHPVLKNESVFYKGTERDCVSDSKRSKDGSTRIRYFQCNANRLSKLPDSDETDDTKSVYYLYIYRLVFHEVLVQAGLEDQSNEISINQTIPSNYSISSHLEVRVVKDWIPGVEKKDVEETDQYSTWPMQTKDFKVLVKKATECELTEYRDVIRQLFGANQNFDTEISLSFSAWTYLDGSFGTPIGVSIDASQKRPFKPSITLANGAHQGDAPASFFIQVGTDSRANYIERNNYQFYCEEPVILFTTKEVVDGWDAQGNAINRHTILDKTWVHEGNCKAESMLTLKPEDSEIPELPKSISYNSKRQISCLQQAIASFGQ